MAVLKEKNMMTSDNSFVIWDRITVSRC